MPRVILLKTTLSIVSTVCLGLWTQACTFENQEPASLKLKEQATYSLSNARTITGAAGTVSDGLIVWGGRGEPIRLIQKGGIVELPSPSGVVRAARWKRPSSSIEVITDEGRFLELELNTSWSIKPVGGVPYKVVAAAATDSGWMIVSTEDGEQLTLQFLRFGMLHAERSRSLLSMPSRGDLHASSYQGLLFLSSKVFPHEIFVVNTSLHVVGQLPAIEGSSRISAVSDSTLKGMVGLPVVPVPSGYIHMLADTRSSMRLVRIYDRLGRKLRERVVGIPFGILHRADERTVLAVRRLGEVELVLHSVDDGTASTADLRVPAK